MTVAVAAEPVVVAAEPVVVAHEQRAASSQGAADVANVNQA
ncbi:hypothetical protein ACFWBS_26130 [Streptomyces mirabilis]|nr:MULTISPECIES: hypothetical protein [Streptomyces]MCX4614831.1 hypothetical protein [Streptomyces mirabilis]